MSACIQKGASDKIAGATLEEYRSKINADAGDVGDEIAKALEELESAQTALDNTKQESVSQKNHSRNISDLTYFSNDRMKKIL